MLLALASITDSLVTFATHVIRDIGYGGVSLLTLTSGVIGVPGSEPTMLFAGFNVFQGHLTLFGIIVFGVIGDVLGACIAYAIGYWGRRGWLQRQGHKLHMSEQRVDSAQGWLHRYGAPAVLVSRWIPFARAAFPYAAGVAELSFWRFVTMTTIGSAVWIAGLGVLGREVGHSWTTWRHHLEYVDYAGAVLVVLVLAWLIVRRARPRRSAAPRPVDAASD